MTGVELDGEAVLFDEARYELHVLNPTAAAVWACCDGAQTLDEMAAELANVFGAPVDEVSQGVRSAVKDFATRGLLHAVQGVPPGHDALVDQRRSTPHFLEEPPEG